MVQRNSPVFFERLHSIEFSDAGVIVVADCMHVSGAIPVPVPVSVPVPVPNEGRNSRSSSELEAEQPALSSSGKKRH